MEEKTPPQKFDIWQHKPWWCQPWSIILTGVVIIGGSWFVLHRVWLSAMVALPITVWWVYFLVIYPRALADLYQSELEN